MSNEPGEGEGASLSSFCGGGMRQWATWMVPAMVLLCCLCLHGEGMWRDAVRVRPVRHCHRVGGVEQLIGGSCTTVVVVYS